MTDQDPERPGTTAGGEPSAEFLPPLDFSSIVFPLYAQALVKLGIIPDPVSLATGENLELAQRLIDLLDLLKDRTKGNLKPEEEKFLETCLQQLHLGYVEKSKSRS
jgi:hypothetical protein